MLPFFGKKTTTFFIENTQRTIFLNYSSSLSRFQPDINKNEIQDDPQWFAMEQLLVKYPTVEGLKKYTYNTWFGVQSDGKFRDIIVSGKVGYFIDIKLKIPFRINETVIQ